MQILPIFAPILIFGAIIVIVVLLLIYQRKKERERTEALRQVAAQLRWNFAEEPPLNMIPNFEYFGLFNSGHSKRMRNLMYGEASGIKAGVFDYIYVTGSGKSSQTHYQTVVYLEPGNLRVPYFSLRPENFMHKIISAFGYQDIDFAQRPEFSRNYLLRGQDEPAIRQVFNDPLLTFYENYGGVCTDAGGNQLLLFRANYCFEPHEFQNYIALALNVLALMPRY
jgi:carbonic anhydrase